MRAAHRTQDAVSPSSSADVAASDGTSARALSEARARVARVLGASLDSRGIYDRVVAKWTGTKKQAVSQWCRPGGTKSIGVAHASLIENDEVRRDLAQLVAGAVWRVVRAPITNAPIAANVATAGRLIRVHAHLVETYLAAHADGHLDPAERRHLRELLRVLVDDLLGLDATLAADELPGERR